MIVTIEPDKEVDVFTQELQDRCIFMLGSHRGRYEEKEEGLRVMVTDKI